MKDGPGVCVRERECVSLCVYHGVIAIMEAGQNVSETVYICIMCIFVYHGVMAFVEAGQNVCVRVCICIMYMFVYHGVIAIM